MRITPVDEDGAASGTSAVLAVSSFDYSHNSLIRIGLAKGDKEPVTLHYEGAKGQFGHKLFHKGSHVEVSLCTEREFQLKKYMAVPPELDFTKMVTSPMPGAIVSVSVDKGDHVQEGQEVAVIEAMKMQNLLKSETEGTVKSVLVQAGDSVAVDQLLIEFE